MFEPSPLEEESLDMHFYILVDEPDQWPSIDYATVLHASNDEIKKLAQRETDTMDVLLVCCDLENHLANRLKPLEAKFRIVLTFQKDSTHLADFQDTIAELCWASYHSHNFDILDANSLLGGPIPIISVNQHMFSNGWQSKQTINSAILFVHNFNHDDKTLEHFIGEAQTAMNIKSISAISLGQGRETSHCQYSVLAQPMQ